MAVYMIGYDLITPGKDYNTLVQAITQAFLTYSPISVPRRT